MLVLGFDTYLLRQACILRVCTAWARDWAKWPRNHDTTRLQLLNDTVLEELTLWCWLVYLPSVVRGGCRSKVLAIVAVGVAVAIMRGNHSVHRKGGPNI